MTEPPPDPTLPELEPPGRVLTAEEAAAYDAYLAAKPPKMTNWRTITANVILVIIAVASAIPEQLGAESNLSVWMSSAQVVGVFTILQSVLKIPLIANWMAEHSTVDKFNKLPAAAG